MPTGKSGEPNRLAPISLWSRCVISQRNRLRLVCHDPHKRKEGWRRKPGDGEGHRAAALKLIFFFILQLKVGWEGRFLFPFFFVILTSNFWFHPDFPKAHRGYSILVEHKHFHISPVNDLFLFLIFIDLKHHIPACRKSL